MSMICMLSSICIGLALCVGSVGIVKMNAVHVYSALGRFQALLKECKGVLT